MITVSYPGTGSSCRGSTAIALTRSCLLRTVREFRGTDWRNARTERKGVVSASCRRAPHVCAPPTAALAIWSFLRVFRSVNFGQATCQNLAGEHRSPPEEDAREGRGRTASQTGCSVPVSWVERWGVLPAACRICGCTSGTLMMEESADFLGRLHEPDNPGHRVAMQEVPDETAYSQGPNSESAT